MNYNLFQAKASFELHKRLFAYLKFHKLRTANCPEHWKEALQMSDPQLLVFQQLVMTNLIDEHESKIIVLDVYLIFVTTARLRKMSTRTTCFNTETFFGSQ